MLDTGPRNDEEIGPETLRTIREIEAEGRTHMGLTFRTIPVAHIEAPKPEQDSTEVEALLALRAKWGDRPGQEH